MTATDLPAADSGGAPSAQPGSDDLIYFNGIDAETGQYAVQPQTVDDLAKLARANPQVNPLRDLRGDSEMRSFGLPPNVDYKKLEDTGWGIIFHESASPDIRAALKPLIALRSKAAGRLFKALDYKTGEQTRDWYRRHDITPGALDPEVVPYYLLIIGSPQDIPFEFQYLLGVDYAVGRLSLAAPADYARYAASLASYETGAAIHNAKQIAYWGTRHLGDRPTELSSSLLVNPLTKGDPNLAGRLKKPLNAEFGFDQKLMLADDATKDALLATLGGAKPPAILFTASHGMQLAPGRPNQQSVQGALLCQDWPGFGMIAPDHYFAASDVPDDANVYGLVAFFFACFGGGTPKADQFFLKPEQLGAELPPLAPQPFMAALPQRLLTHPKGSALAVVGHIDRAWGFSIQAPKMTGSQIAPFRNGLGYIMQGDPIGHAVRDQFGGHYAALSNALLALIAPCAPSVDDRDLVTYWLERNDAQNYVMLGDPAARLQAGKLLA
jgi:hypothetical protein